MARRIITVAAGVIALFAFVWAHQDIRTHNSQGGYIEACGEQPGLLGDDC